MKTKKILGIALAVCMTMGLTTVPAMAEDKKTFVFGDTTFNAENEEADINPQNTYAGWACIRYGVGETLFRYSDTMEIEPWIAKEYENVDELTWKITLNDGVVFSNGRVCDGQAVKESLEYLVENHERAAGDLCIDSIEADGNVVTIKTTEPKPALINYLSDPYGCIIDVQAGITDNGIVIGTGPYVATDLVTDDHLTLVKNENYWDSSVKLSSIKVIPIGDSDTLAMALQSGEIDAFFCTAGLRTTIIEELAQQCPIKFLSISDSCSKKLESAYDTYVDYTIPANTYTGQTEEIKTVAVQAVLLASNKLSDIIVESLTEFLFEHSADLQYSVPLNLQLDETSAVKGISIPFHPGAVKYYKKHNIKVKSE